MSRAENKHKPAAMILAAGRGERMRPLTDHTPKPLLRVNGKTLIDYHLENLSTAGIEFVVINLCWLGHLIQSHVGNGEHYGLQIEYSHEPEALETAGGIAKALASFERLRRDEFLIMNADVYCANPLPQLCNEPLGETLGHLLLTTTPDYLPGDFSLNDGIVQPKYKGSSEPLLTFCGMARYSPSLFDNVGSGAQAMLPLFNAAISQQQLGGSMLDGPWLDVGTPQRLEMAQQRTQQVSD
ncbi:MAG: nucleotidyltransferase family protein [Pseudomonadales bacterium]